MTAQTPLQAIPAAPLSPILALPLELQLEMVPYLSDKHHPSLAILRRTHPTFRYIVPRDQFTSQSRSSKNAQLLTAEDDYSYLFPPDHFPCYLCCKSPPWS